MVSCVLFKKHYMMKLAIFFCHGAPPTSLEKVTNFDLFSMIFFLATSFYTDFVEVTFVLEAE